MEGHDAVERTKLAALAQLRKAGSARKAHLSRRMRSVLAADAAFAADDPPPATVTVNAVATGRIFASPSGLIATPCRRLASPT